MRKWRRLTKAQLSMLVYIWNVAHSPRRKGAGVARCVRGGHYENALSHEALLRRGLIRESSGHKFTRVTARGMRVLNVKANQWRRVSVT